MKMLILDSLSLTGAATKIKQQTVLNSATPEPAFKSQGNIVENSTRLKAAPIAISASESYEMTTNKYIKLQQQQQHSEAQHKDQLDRIFVIQKMTSPSAHKIKEMFKNNNENNNGEPVIENNTTIANNTMPQEELQNNDKNTKNENSSGAEWGNVPATFTSHHNCNDTTDHQTTDINAFTRTANDTSTNTTATIATFKALNVDNADVNNVRRMEEIILTNIQNNVDLNNFALPPETAADTTTITTTHVVCEGMLVPLKKFKNSCSTKNYSNRFSATDSDDGGSYCHHQNNNNRNNNGSSNNNISSRNSNNNSVMLNTNSFVTVECSPLICENERVHATQNGYENNGNVTAGAADADTATATFIINNNSTNNKEIVAEFSNVLGEQATASPYFNSEKFIDPIGYLGNNNVSLAASPVDSVLENFEKFLNAVKLKDQRLNESVAECQDLIDFSVDPINSLDWPKENVVRHECNKLDCNKIILNTDQSYSDDTMHANTVDEKQCTFENLLYCDLNETLEEQHLLESKEILSLTTAELTPTEAAVAVENAHIDDSDKINSNIVMVHELNETLAKTPVTCSNVYSNYKNDEISQNKSTVQHETCAVVQRKESCQNSNSCRVRTPPTTTEPRVSLKNTSKNKICSSLSIENNSTPIQNKIEIIHNLNQSANTSNTANIVAATKIASVSWSTTDTQPHTQNAFAEYKTNFHHSQIEHLQQQTQIRDQFTSAYTLRDLAKCLKPSADEDIIYTLNFTENQNEKEKLQKFNFNLNSNETQQISSSETKSIQNCVSSKKQVNFNESVQNFNENNLYNKFFHSVKVLEADNATKHPLGDQVTNSTNSESESKLNYKKSIGDPELHKIKDTQFLEIKNLSTPKFYNLASQPVINIQKADIVSDRQDFKDCANLCENLENVESFDNELKLDCNGKIYTRVKNSQPLLYLTFVWPTKNEGQVLTTRRQVNDDQGENETEREEPELEKEYRFNKQFINSNSNINNNNKNVDDKCECSCELPKRILEKSYGTCNRNHVEDTHKGQQLKPVESANLEKHQKETFNEKDDGDLFDEKILIRVNKQKRECENPCIYKTDLRQSEALKNEKYFQEEILESQAKSVLISENETKSVTNKKNKENLQNNNNIESEIELQKIKQNFVENNSVSFKEIFAKSAKCVKQSENINDGQVSLKSENNSQIKTLLIGIKHNNTNLNKTESVRNQDNGENILNPNEGLKRLNETSQLLLQATYTPTINHHHHHRNQLLEREEDDQLNLEEFEASQRLKRLLEQHQQLRTRYDSIPTTTTNQFDNYKQTNTTTESLKTEIAAIHSTELQKDDLLTRPQRKQEGVVNTVETSTLSKLNSNPKTTTTTKATKANKLQADCEITLERSSLLRANEHKQSIIEINKKLFKQKEEQIGIYEVKKRNAKDIEEQEVKVLNSKETEENVNEYKRSSPQAFVSKKIVRLSQQQQQILIHQHSQLYSNPSARLDLIDNQQQQQQQNQKYVVIEKSPNLRFPPENIDKTEISQKPSTSSEVCNLNLQHIVKTKQLLQQQQEEQDLLIRTQTKSCSPPPSAPQFNEYKSAFVSTKPEIYKYIKPLTGTTGNLTTTTTATPLIPATVASISEFDTQRFSNFLYLNHFPTSANNNQKSSLHYSVNNHNNNNTNCQIAQVLSTQQQEQLLLHQYQHYPLYTTNFIDPIQFPYCYDELFLNETQQQQPEQHTTLSPANTTDTITTTNTPTIPTNIVNNGVTEVDDDLISISSNNSSPCDCINCQQQIEHEIDPFRDRDLLYTIDTNVLPVVVLSNETQAAQLQQQPSLKMREVNGQLRGLLKKPNRPPPARKNRVVFDETRNEFFEADYIILIREDCAYDEEDEEPCTCGEHELVRLCCEEGCQCNYSTAPAATDESRTPQSPKYAPPIEFVDEAALSPPDGYKDNGLKNTLGGALSGHIFGAQHLQQLQVIQRLQQQRAAMLAARNNSQIPLPPPAATNTPPTAASVNHQSSAASSTCSSSSPLNLSSTPSSAIAAVATTVVSNNSMNQTAAAQHSPDDDAQAVCTECAECAECAAKQLQQDAECNSLQCQEDLTAPLGVPAVALLPIHTSSPERRMTQKEIIAGEERPRYVLQAQYKSSPVSERRIVREANENLAGNSMGSPANIASSSASVTATSASLSAGGDTELSPPALPAKPGATSNNNDLSDSEKPPPIPPKEYSPSTQISGILKGGKLWKQDSISQHSDDQTNTTSEDEAGSASNATIKRSVRFVTEEISNDEVDGQLSNLDEDNQINELIPIKKHSTLFKNALRPNSAVQQLFPSTVSHQTLTSEALRAFDESKRAGCLVSSLPGSAGDSDTLRRSMERNILRRSLIKKKAIKSDISLEDRIKQLTCGIDEDNDESVQENGEDHNSKIEDNADLAHRDSPAGEENPQKFNVNGSNSDKSFSPNSSVSSSSSGSSAYKKITEIFNREKKNQEKIMEMEENPIGIIPQECRCPAAPDLGMGIQVPVVHTQIHRAPPRQTEAKRQFLSTLAPLTACVAGNKDDLSSYYTLAAAHHNQVAQNAHAAEYNFAALLTGDQNTMGVSQSTGDEIRKVAPDVIAGTPGQEQQDELAAFAQQEANRTDKIKKRYSNEPTNTKENKEVNSDDDEGNDYGFNKRPSVRGIKPKFSSTNEILQQMQDQLSQQMPNVVHSQPLPQPMKSYTLPKQSSASAMTKQLSQQQPSPQNVPHPSVSNSQQQLPQQQQMCSAVAPAAAMQVPANAAIAQQQTEQRTWSFYSETGGASEQQRLPVESAAAAMQQTYYQTLPAGAMFRHTMIHQHQQHGAEEAMLYAQNCQTMAATIEPQPHYGHYARSPTRRPESPPPLRNYHQTMVLIPYNAETYSQFAATNMDPKVAHIQRQNILEYQQVGEMTQVTQQTIRVPIGYALPGMQLHVVAGRGHGAQYATAAAGQTQHHQHQRIMTQRYQFAQEASMAGFSERGVPEGAAAVSHSDCTGSGMVSPTAGQQIAMQQQQQQQQMQQNGAQIAQQQQQQQVNCQQQQPQAQNNMQSAAQGSVYYAMNV